MNICEANYYLAILFAEENLKNAKNQLDNSKEQVEKSRKLVEAGASAPGANLSFEAQMLLDEQKVIMGQNDVEKSYLNLKQLLKINDNIKIANPDVENLLNEGKEILSLNEQIEKSLNHQPKLKVADLQLRSAEISKKIVSGALYPSLAAFGGISTDYYNKAQEVTGYTDSYTNSVFLVEGNPVNVGIPVEIPILQNQKYIDQLDNNIGYGVGLQLKIPIYDNYNTRSQIQKSKLNIENYKLSREQIIQNIKSEVQSAHADFKSAKLQYLASKKTMEAQQLAFDNAQKQFNVGLLPSYEYLNVQNQLESAINSFIISKYDYVFKSLVLDFYLGENISFSK